MNKITAILLGVLIASNITTCINVKCNEIKINELIIDRNTNVKELDSLFWVCSGIAEKAIEQRKTLQKQLDSCSYL